LKAIITITHETKRRRGDLQQYRMKERCLCCRPSSGSEERIWMAS